MHLKSTQPQYHFYIIVPHGKSSASTNDYLGNPSKIGTLTKEFCYQVN